MVAVEHVLDLENTVNFDRHTSVLAPYCNCWDVQARQYHIMRADPWCLGRMLGGSSPHMPRQQWW